MEAPRPVRHAAARFLAAACAALLGWSCPPTARSQAPAPAASTNSYMRVANPDTNTIELQIALRQLLPSKTGAPVVWLVAAAHIAETNYYAALQKHLDAQALVLFEGVRDRSSPTGDSEPQKNNIEADESSLQFTLAKSLGLAFQLSAINYDRPHFRNSDMTLEQIGRVLSGGADHTPRTVLPSGEARSAPAQSSREFDMLIQVMDGTSFIGAIANGVVRFLGSSPKLQATTKVMLVELLGNLQGDMAQMSALPPDMKQLFTVLLHARNQVVLRDLKTELEKPDPPKSIAVFYGAAHMADLEGRICKELNYRPGEEQWLPAITVKLPDSGLTPADLQLIRGMVKWQMQLLQPAQPRTTKDSP